MRQNIIIIWVRLPKLENIYLHSTAQAQANSRLYIKVNGMNCLYIYYIDALIVDNFDINMMK